MKLIRLTLAILIPASSLLFSILSPNNISAASLTDVSDNLSRLKTGVSATHTWNFTLATALGSSSKLRFTQQQPHTFLLWKQTLTTTVPTLTVTLPTLRSIFSLKTRLLFQLPLTQLTISQLQPKAPAISARVAMLVKHQAQPPPASTSTTVLHFQLPPNTPTVTP